MSTPASRQQAHYFDRAGRYVSTATVQLPPSFEERAQPVRRDEAHVQAMNTQRAEGVLPMVQFSHWGWLNGARVYVQMYATLPTDWSPAV